MLKTAELIEWGTKIIDTDLATRGKVNRHVAIMGPVGVPLIVSLNCPEALKQILAQAAIDQIRQLRKAGTLSGVVEIAEAWVAPDQPGDDQRPRDRPDREEIVLIHAYGEDGKAFAAWHLERTSIGVRRGAAKYSEDITSTTWLDDAFAQAIEGTA